MPHVSFNTTVGFLTLFQDTDALVAIEWGQASDDGATPLLDAARQQIDAYFDGAPIAFDLPVRPVGTAFQRNVWRHLQHIPYGSIETYGDVAAALNTSARAVGTACGRNPLPIVIPCHRVVGAGHALVGFSGGSGVDTKNALLCLENAPGFSTVQYALNP